MYIQLNIEDISGVCYSKETSKGHDIWFTRFKMAALFERNALIYFVQIPSGEYQSWIES